MITCSTLSGKAVCCLVWDMNKAENDAYLEKALSGIPKHFSGKLLEVPVGCRFQARCARVHERCRQEYTVLTEIRPGQQAACHLYDSAEEQLDHPIYLDKAAGC